MCNSGDGSMKLGSEIGVRLLRVFYWGLWLAEIGVAVTVFNLLFRRFVGGTGITDEGVITLTIASIVALLSHYVLTIPIGKKLAADRAKTSHYAEREYGKKQDDNQ